VAGRGIRGQLVKSGFYCLTLAHQMKQMENAHNTATGVTSGKCGKSEAGAAGKEHELSI